jgi:hypothetical protein
MCDWNPRAMVRPDTFVPEHIRDGFSRYVEYGIPPGNGLRRILEDRSISETLPFLDEVVSANLASTVRFIYNNVPGDAWGSPARVKAWKGVLQEC